MKLLANLSEAKGDQPIVLIIFKLTNFCRSNSIRMYICNAGKYCVHISKLALKFIIA